MASSERNSEDIQSNKPVGVCMISRGYVLLNEQNLKKILSHNDIPDEGPNNLVIVSIVGDRHSGKSLLLNLFLQYFRSNGDGSWFNVFLKGGFKDGFPVNSGNRAFEYDISQIYAWPQIMSYQDENTGDTYRVLLLDADVKKDKDLKVIQAVCGATSSVIVDNRMTNFKVDYLEAIEKFKEFHASNDFPKRLHQQSVLKLPFHFCQNVHFVIHDFPPNQSYPWGKEEKAKSLIRDTISKEFPSFTTSFSLLEENCQCFLLKSPDQEILIQDTNDKLKVDSKLATQLKILVNKLITSIQPQVINSTILEHFGFGVDVVNSFFRMQARQELNNAKNCIPPPPALGDDIINDIDQEMVDVDQSPHEPVSTDCIPATDQNFMPSNSLISNSVPCEISSSSQENSELSDVIENELTDKISHLQIKCEPDASQKRETLIRKDEMTSQSAYFPQTNQSVTDAHSNDATTDQNLGQNNQAIDDICVPKIMEILKNHKESITVSLDVNEQVCTDALTEFSEFLQKNNIPVSKQVEMVKQLKKNLNLQYAKASQSAKKMSNAAVKHATVNATTQPQFCDNALNNSSGHENASAKIPGPVFLKIEDETKCADNTQTFDPDQTNKEINSNQEPMDTTTSSTNKIDASEPKWIENVKSLYKKQMTDLISDHLSANIFLEETNFNEMHAKSVVRTNEQIQKYFDKCANPPYALPDEIKGKDGKPNTEAFLVSSEIITNLNRGVESEHNQRRSILVECREKCKKELSVPILQKWVIQFVEGRVTGTDFLTRLIATKVNAPSSKLGILLVNEIKRDPDIKIYSDSFQHIEKCLDSFKKDVNKKFECNRSFGPTKFMGMIDGVKKSTMKLFNCDFAPAQEILNYGIENYKLQYTKQNEIINQHEIILAERLLPQIKDFYRNMMKSCTNDKIFMGTQLEQLHDLVVENAITAFWNSCRFQPNQEMQTNGLKFKIEEFNHALKSEFQTYVNSNQLKLMKINGQILAFQMEQRKNYNDEMTHFLPKRGQFLNDVQDFDKKHVSSKTEAIKLLQMEISTLQLKISHEEYVKTLGSSIDKDWVEIKKEYERLKQREEEYIRTQKVAEDQQRREFEKEEKKREAAIKVKAQEEEFNKHTKKVSTSPQEPTSQIRPQRSSSGTSFKITEAVDRSEIQGLAVEFGFSVVRVGRMVKNKVEIVPNLWGEEWTPTFLSVSKENEIQIGKETTENKNKIRIAEAMTSPGNRIPTLLLNGKYEVVKPEVGIALFLSRIKTDVEKNIGGRWTSTVITVPLCLTSMQRQGVQNAAKLAGFDEVRLINDTSAAALYFQEMRDYSEDKCLLVGVVHDFDYYFDAALYGWRQMRGSNFEMEMMGSCGNLHSTGSPKCGIIASVKRGCTTVLETFIGKLEDEARPVFRNMIGTNKDKITANICINYGTQTEIENLVKHYGRTTENANIFVLGGAAILAERLSKYSDNAPLSTHYIKERATYAFERNSLIQNKTSMPKIFEGYTSIVGPRISDDHTIGCLSEGQQQIVIWETSQNLRHQVGTIVVEGTDCSTFKPRPEYKVKFILRNEGIFNVDKVYYKYHDQEHEIQYQWKTPLIPESDLVKSKSFVESMARDEKRELLEKTKNELSVITDKIKEGMHKVEGKLIAEKLLSGGVSEATTMLCHPKTTQEMLENKIIFLTRLHDKYLLI